MIDLTRGKSAPRLFIAIAGLSGVVAACTPTSTTPTVTVGAGTLIPLQPSATFGPPEPTRTHTPFPSDPPTATLDIAATLVAMEEPELTSSIVSPDGVWRADVLIYPRTTFADGDYSYEVLKLVRVADGSEQVADSQLIVSYGLGAYGLDGLFWSANSQYFYYTASREGVPDGCGYWIGSAMRLEIASLEKEYLSSALFSPDKNHVAAWRAQDQSLVVWDVNSGELVGSPVEAEAGPGPMAWSPDGQSLVVVQNQTYCPLAGPSAAIRLDLPDLARTPLFESKTQGFESVTWDDPDQLTLPDETGQQWTFNFATGHLEPAP